MLAVIFEVEINEGQTETYLDIAGELRPLLAEIDGFISIERFESMTVPGKILSLSFWRDEKAIEDWRTLERHRAAQSKGRAGVFKDYHLRVASVIRDYGMSDRDDTPTDSVEIHDA